MRRETAARNNAVAFNLEIMFVPGCAFDIVSASNAHSTHAGGTPDSARPTKTTQKH
jgi:hypothetical protein